MHRLWRNGQRSNSAAVASWLLGFLGISLGGWIGYLIAGFIGACILIAVVRALTGGLQRT
jgi:uncharacterized membrane protein YeaQ/YmgE (transglycosylase-associated protein family)